MKRVFITGASGFVGRALTTALAGAGFDVRAAARHVSAVPAAPSVEAVLLPDLAFPVDWTPLISGMDTIVHLAGIAHTSGIAEESYDIVNRAATAGLAQAATATGIRRLIFVSSIRAQTGPSADHVVTEADDPRPSDAYGRSKLAAEAAVRTAGVPFSILRPVLIYGPGAKGNLASLMRLATLPFPLPFGAFANRRSMLAVGNLVSAIRFLLDAPETAGLTYVVADDMALSLAEIITLLRQAQNRRACLFGVPPRLFEFALKATGRAEYWERLGGNLIADAGKLRKAGWVQNCDPRGALAAMVHAASPRKSGTAERSTL